MLFRSNFSLKARRQIRKNYEDFVNNKKNTFINAATQIIKDVVNKEQLYLQYLSRINVVPYNGSYWTNTDGFQENNGNVVIYNLSGTTKVGPTNPNNPTPPTTTDVELNQDIKIIGGSLNDYFEAIKAPVQFDYGGEKYIGYLSNGIQPAYTDSELRKIGRAHV